MNKKPLKSVKYYLTIETNDEIILKSFETKKEVEIFINKENNIAIFNLIKGFLIELSEIYDMNSEFIVVADCGHDGYQQRKFKNNKDIDKYVYKLTDLYELEVSFSIISGKLIEISKTKYEVVE